MTKGEITMDDTSIESTLRAFSEVWPRVSAAHPTAGHDAGSAAPLPDAAASPDAAPGEAERLRAFMRSAVNASALYSALARRFKGASPLLNLLAAEERRHLSALAVEYYLLTGDSFTPRPAPPDNGALLSALRRAWQAEGVSEQSYLSAAQISPLGALYRAHAENEHRHRALLRGLIARTLQ